MGNAEREESFSVLRMEIIFDLAVKMFEFFLRKSTASVFYFKLINGLIKDVSDRGNFKGNKSFIGKFDRVLENKIDDLFDTLNVIIDNF
jgi:hypothetical protein